MTNLRDYGGLNLLTGLVWGEAEGEILLGKIACAWVVKNRMIDSRWPNTWEEVILQPRQFSCFNLDEPRHHLVLKYLTPSQAYKDPFWRECRWAAAGVYFNWLQDPTDGANHYHTTSMKVYPKWAKSECRTLIIGGHVFYKL